MRNPVETSQVPDYSSYSALDLVRSGVETHRMEVIDLSSVIIDTSIVDMDHVQRLADSMQEVSGQLQPILVRAREVRGRVVRDIMDGYHRAAGKQKNGDLTIDAHSPGKFRKTVAAFPGERYFCAQRVVLNYSVEHELSIGELDYVISKVHARIRSGMSESDVRTILNDYENQRKGKTKAEDTRISTRVDVPTNESSGNNKSSITYISVDGLRHSVSKVAGLKRRMTREDVQRAIVEHVFPNDERLLKWLLLQYAKQNGLMAYQLHHVAQEVKRHMTTTMTSGQLANLICDIPLPVVEVLDGSEQNNGKTTTEQSDNRRAINVYEANDAENSHKRNGTLENRVETVESLNQRIDDLECTLLTVRDQLNAAIWWRNASYLSQYEKMCLEKVFFGSSTISQLAAEINASENDVLLLLKNVLAKRQIRQDI